MRGLRDPIEQHSPRPHTTHQGKVMRGHGEKATGWLSAIQEAPWPETEGIVTLILDLPASRTVKNKFMLFIICLIYSVLL